MPADLEAANPPAVLADPIDIVVVTNLMADSTINLAAVLVLDLILALTLLIKAVITAEADQDQDLRASIIHNNHTSELNAIFVRRLVTESDTVLRLRNCRSYRRQLLRTSLNQTNLRVLLT